MLEGNTSLKENAPATDGVSKAIWGSRGQAPEQRCGKEGVRKGRGKPLALIKGFSSPLHNTISTLQFIAK